MGDGIFVRLDVSLMLWFFSFSIVLATMFGFFSSPFGF